MKYQTREVEKGTEITVKTEKEAAIVVREEDEERIFLPSPEIQQNTYYVEQVNQLVEIEEGYKVVYSGEPHSIEVFSR